MWRGIIVFSLFGRGVAGFIVGAILNYSAFFLLASQKLTDEDTLTIYLAIIGASLAVILYFVDNGRGSGFTLFRAIVVGLSYHAVFWSFTIIHYDFTNAWEAIRVGLVNSIIYLGIILVIGFILRKFNLYRISASIQRVKQKKQQTNLRNEISWLKRNAENILNEMRGFLNGLDEGFTKTPSDSRNLLFLLSSISNEDNVEKIGQQNITQGKNATDDNIKQLFKSINQLKAVSRKVKFYRRINAIKNQITELEMTVRQLDECVKNHESTLLDNFKQEDQRIIYVNQVQNEYQNLVNQIRNLP